jgi:hypothetical protein
MISLTFDLRMFQPQAKLKTVIGKLLWGNGTVEGSPALTPKHSRL